MITFDFTQYAEFMFSNFAKVLDNISSDPTFDIWWLIIWVLFIFDYIMKWIAMYRAWTRREAGRFVCLLIFNTCGILPIIYLATHKKID
jgi:hypothetical protein